MVDQSRFIRTAIVAIALLIFLSLVLCSYQDTGYKALAALPPTPTPATKLVTEPMVDQFYKDFLPAMMNAPVPTRTPPPQLPAPIYSHSWYITSTATSVLWDLGVSDGTRDNANCTNSMAILDFGQVGNESAYGYNGYGTYYFPAGAAFVSDYDIEVLAEAYAGGWYSVTNSCPRLKLVIGTSNYHQCPWGNQRGNCNPYDAGTQWGNLVNTVKSWEDNQGHSWQITIWAGSDMEQPSPGQNWDCGTPTREFVRGFNDHNLAYALFMNYGTAWLPNNCWTQGDVYYVSWDATWNKPLPEIYSSYATDSWLAIRRQYFMIFAGVVTECQQADPITGNTCIVDNKPQYTPNAAWNDLWNQLIVNQVSQSYLEYATNIKFQGR